MPKGKPNKKYTGEFKQMVVETMRKEKMSCRETELQFELPRTRAEVWERIYIEEGAEGLYVERRGRACSVGGTRKGRPLKLDKKIKDNLIAENQQLKAEIDNLKKLNALAIKEERQNKRRR